jgi:hypothetical protein
MAPWGRVKKKKLKIASQEGVKLRSEYEETHLRTFCVAAPGGGHRIQGIYILAFNIAK